MIEQELKLLYGSLAPFKNHLPEELEHHQEELVTALLEDDHFRKYPPSREFQRIFWRHIVYLIEKSGAEVDERIYARYLDLLSSNKINSDAFASEAPSPSFFTYFWPTNSRPSTSLEKLVLLESRTTIEAGTTGLRTWRASLMLGEWLLEHPEIVRGKHVLELGAGVGFLGILISKLQSVLDPDSINEEFSIVMSDVAENVLERNKYNVSLPPNAVKRPAEVKRLDWFDALLNPRPVPFAPQPRPQVILGADIVFDPSLIKPLVETLWVLSTSEPAVPPPEIWVALSLRRESTVSGFVETSQSRGFVVDEIPWGLPSKRLFPGAWEGGNASETVEIKLFLLRSNGDR